jgi:hypothetical protein
VHGVILNRFLRSLLRAQSFINSDRSSSLDPKQASGGAIRGGSGCRISWTNAVDQICAEDGEVGLDVQVLVELFPAPLLTGLVTIVLSHGSGYGSGRRGSRASRGPFAAGSGVAD